MGKATSHSKIYAEYIGCVIPPLVLRVMCEDCTTPLLRLRGVNTRRPCVQRAFRERDLCLTYAAGIWSIWRGRKDRAAFDRIRRLLRHIYQNECEMGVQSKLRTLKALFSKWKILRGDQVWRLRWRRNVTLRTLRVCGVPPEFKLHPWSIFAFDLGSNFFRYLTQSNGQHGKSYVRVVELFTSKYFTWLMPYLISNLRDIRLCVTGRFIHGFICSVACLFSLGVFHQVMITQGKDKGQTGKVLEVYRKKNRVLVEGLNLAKKHIKRTPDQPGGIITKEMPVHVSGVMVSLCGVEAQGFCFPGFAL